MSELTPHETMLVRKFAAALRRAREEELEPLRNALYFLELLCAGLADLNAELRRERAATMQNHLCEKCRSVKIIEQFRGPTLSS